MKQEYKYYVEFLVNDHLNRGEFTVSHDFAPRISRRTSVVKDAIVDYWKKITKKGTRVEITKIEYKGTITRIS